ncbi:uncharacterized protein LOC126830336 [Patella vulgata]|uniref:uncharacterized protein LOC126830336 n=1 Tax=Patella vulgata TaxID=6465 RepID=UPI0024A80EAC|nr:uncharacterized protein LOC126830336 [Patella vulgata]XP_050416663.2 uncharacterized protein LOC126830336 [Patella vulgata]
MEISQLFGLISASSLFIYSSIFLLSWAVYKMFLYPYLSPLNKIPSKRNASFLFGNMKEIFAGEAIDVYIRWIEDLNSSIIRYYHLFGKERLVVADADAMKQIMVTNGKNYVKPTFLFGLFIRVAGYGLVSLNGKEHLTQRKLCTGAFKIAVIKNMLPSFQRHAEELIDNWRKQIEKGDNILKVHHDLHNVTLDIICECGFGYTTEALCNPEQPETKSLTAIMSSFKPSFLRIIAPFIALNLPTEENKSFKENMRRCDELIHDIITNKKQEINKQEGNMEERCTNLLTMLLFARDVDTHDGLSDKQIRDHVMTFMLAGHETTSSGMCWFLLTMAQNPEIQTRLRQEVTSLLPSKGQPITFEDVEKMTYLNCVVKETLRLYPSAPMTFREAVNDDNINGYFIPKGTVINIHVGALHRNTKYWKEPEKFIPERFLDESSIHPYSYMPFIAGSRMCIGYKFALLEMKVLLAFLIREFKFEVLPDVTYTKKQLITMKPNPLLELQATIVDY